MKKKFLLTHQTQFMRAPYLFPETRFFVFTAGYGAGKTSSVAAAVLYDMYKLKDAKDKEGRRPRLGLGGKSLGHLVKTTLGYILSDLENSKTPYKYNSKDNVLSVGNADLYLVSLSRPGDIVGYDVCGFYGDEVDDLGSVTASSAADMTFEAIKAINERTRQVIPGFRSPFVKLASTSQGQKGLYRVVTQFNKENTGYVRIKARTRDNTNLKLEYVDSLYRFYTETECIDAKQKILFSRNGYLYYAPIIKIKKGDFIFNSQGWQEVEAKIIKGKKDTIKIGKVIATFDHKIYTGFEWEVNEKLKTVEFFNEGDIIWNFILKKYQTHAKTVMQKFWNMTDLNGIYTQGKNISCEKPKRKIFYFIIMFMKSLHSPKFPKALWYIIKTETLLIITRIIWNVFQLKNIKPTTQKEAIEPQNLKKEESNRLRTIKEPKNNVIAAVKTISQKNKTQDSAACAKIQTEEKTSKDVKKTIKDTKLLKKYVLFVASNFHTLLQEKIFAQLNAETQLNELLKVQSTIRPVNNVKRNLKLIQKFAGFVLRDVNHDFTTKEKLVVDLSIKGEPEFIIGGLRCHNCKVYLEGEFLSVGSGRIFPDFDWEHNFARLPMDRMLQPGEELYWSQDFNSLSAGEKILTNKGYRPIKDIKVGDFVLTRQGYKKVLTNKEMGEKLVVRCGSLWTTLEHPFITEKGDEERCKIQNYYYLPMHTKLKLHLVRTLQLKLQKLEFYLMELSIEKIDRETITNLEKEKTQKFYTEQFTNIISAPFLKVLLFTIKMGLWTIGLKVLNYLQEKHILKHITAEKELRNTGNKDALNLQGWCVSSAEKLLQDVSKLLLPVQKHVNLNIEQKNKKQQENKDVLGLKLVRIRKRGKIANRLNWFADGVALAMKERKGLITALRALKPAHTTADGNVLYGVKRTVWDLEVEDAHEFFAENILVHNCGYFRGCVAVLRGNCIYVVKRYEFEQIKDAPQVVRYDFPHNKIIWIPDASAKSEIMTFAAELRKYQIFWAFRGKNPNIEDTVFLVNKLLYMRRLVFTEMAKETAEACSLALRDTKTGLLPKGIGKRSPIHDIDALRMLCYFLIFTPVMKDIRDLTIRRRLEQWKDDEEYAGDAAAGRKIIKTGGFSIIEPDLL